MPASLVFDTVDFVLKVKLAAISSSSYPFFRPWRYTHRLSNTDVLRRKCLPFSMCSSLYQQV
jgi:hypothetical protein